MKKITLSIGISLYAFTLFGQITDIISFLDVCPTNDPAVDTILKDFEIRVDKVLVTDFPCYEPVSEMDIADYTEPLIYLQTFRVIYYMDRYMKDHLPWTNLSLYDWMKENVDGINIVTGGSGGGCCTMIDDKLFFGIGDSDSANREFDKNWMGISGNIAFFAHEVRHATGDGYHHSSCCGITAGCDEVYDENDLAPYAIQYWLMKSWLTGFINVGAGTRLNETEAEYMFNWYLAGLNYGFRERFCENIPDIISAESIINPFGISGDTSTTSPTVLANYPLSSDLSDITGNNGDVTLSGVDPPAGAVCVNGIYPNAATTPQISGFDENNFQIEVDFYRDPSSSGTKPILVGGTGGRWIGVCHNHAGNLFFLYNNTQTITTETPLVKGVWYNLKIQYVEQHVRILLNDVTVLDRCIPPLSTYGYYNFSTAHFGSGLTLYGCIRNLIISGGISIPPIQSVNFTEVEVGDSIVIGDQIYKASGTYLDTLYTPNGCDSIVVTYLSVVNGYYILEEASICKGDNFILGSQVLTDEGTYAERFESLGGLDSIVELSLSVFEVDTEIHREADTLIAAASDAGYLWLDCSTEFSNISGENSQKFIPSVTGEYAVEVTQNGCVDTSACYTVTLTDLPESDLSANLNVFPNPSQGFITIELDRVYSNIFINVRSIQGQLISKETYMCTDKLLLKLEEENGIYIAEIATDKGVLATLKLMVY
ncbi:MAG: T9SS type A sorting domain-containing protein [Bacteroidales bacterium]|nr:T9SS type A sorting domain-containing protein [Bacteroidales bacterium]